MTVLEGECVISVLLKRKLRSRELGKLLIAEVVVQIIDVYGLKIK